MKSIKILAFGLLMMASVAHSGFCGVYKKSKFEKIHDMSKSYLKCMVHPYQEHVDFDESSFTTAGKLMFRSEMAIFAGIVGLNAGYHAGCSIPNSIGSLISKFGITTNIENIDAISNAFGSVVAIPGVTMLSTQSCNLFDSLQDSFLEKRVYGQYDPENLIPGKRCRNQSDCVLRYEQKSTIEKTVEAGLWSTAAIAGCTGLTTLGVSMIAPSLDTKVIATGSAAACVGIYGALVASLEYAKQNK